MNNKMSAATNSLNWFEIPAVDIARAKKFYETIFEITMHDMEMPDMKYAMFPFDPANAKVAGALAKSPFHTPSATGSIIYFKRQPRFARCIRPHTGSRRQGHHAKNIHRAKWVYGIFLRY